MAMNLVLEVDGVSYPVSVDAEEHVYTVELPSGRHTIDVRRMRDGHALSLLSGGDSYEVWALPQSGGYRVQVFGASFDVDVEDALRAQLKKLEAAAGGTREDVVEAPMPGVVVEIRVAPGDRIAAGEPIVIVEAMKMRNEFGAKMSGVVTSIAVELGQTVERKTKLFVVTPENTETPS